MHLYRFDLKVISNISFLYEVLRATLLVGSKYFVSVVVGIPLQGVAVDDNVAFNDSGVLAFVTHNRWSIKVDLVIDDKQRIVVVDDIVVNAHTVQVLLEQILEEEVLLFKGSLLLFDSKL